MNVYQAAWEAVVRDPRYQQNLSWGKPRSGHPEGTVGTHIQELEHNLMRLRSRCSEVDYWKLRLLVHVHDTFKPDARQGAAISDPQSHASLARAFLAEFCDDADLLAMVQNHDEPYALWQQVRGKGNYSQARFQALVGAIRDWDLFVAFLIIDNCTAGKSREPLEWFLVEIAAAVSIQWSVRDILEV